MKTIGEASGQAEKQQKTGLARTEAEHQYIQTGDGGSQAISLLYLHPLHYLPPSTNKTRNLGRRTGRHTFLKQGTPPWIEDPTKEHAKLRWTHNLRGRPQRLRDTLVLNYATWPLTPAQEAQATSMGLRGGPAHCSGEMAIALHTTLNSREEPIQFWRLSIP